MDGIDVTLERVQDGLGDVVFDALLLNAIVSKVHGLDPNRTFQAAAEKIEVSDPPSRYAAAALDPRLE